MTRPKVSLFAFLLLLLAVGAFLGGRRAGYDNGYRAGTANVRDAEFEAGKGEGYWSLRADYSPLGLWEEAYSAGPLIAARLKIASAEPSNERARVELDALLNEVVSRFAPKPNDSPETNLAFSIRAFPTNYALVVSTDGRRRAQIREYLASELEAIEKQMAAEPQR
jgi:hypothetical protein